MSSRTIPLPSGRRPQTCPPPKPLSPMSSTGVRTAIPPGGKHSGLMASSVPERGSGGAPAALVLLAAAAGAFFVLPLVGLVSGTPWDSARTLLTSPEALTALRLSMLASLSATVIALIVGVPLAWILARLEFPGRAVLRALTVLPMVLPPVVGGVALLLAFGRRGLLGGWLAKAFGIHLAFTTPGAILAETFVAMPFLVITVEAGLRQMDRRFE